MKAKLLQAGVPVHLLLGVGHSVGDMVDASCRHSAMWIFPIFQDVHDGSKFRTGGAQCISAYTWFM